MAARIAGRQNDHYDFGGRDVDAQVKLSSMAVNMALDGSMCVVLTGLVKGN